MIGLLVGLGGGVALGGFTGLIRPQELPFTINTDPSGMKAQFSDGQGCTTPCTINQKTSQQITVTLIDEKRKKAQERMRKIIPMW